jgi:uncharacterized protein YbaR (Trm112 family)
LKGESCCVSCGNGLPISVTIRVLVSDAIRDAADDNALTRLIHPDAEKEAVALHLDGEGIPAMLPNEFVGC